MTTTPKSKCCGADVESHDDYSREDRYISTSHFCSKCKKRCKFQDQPTSRLDEVSLIASQVAWTIAEHYKDGIKYEVGKENFIHAHQYISDQIKTAIHQSLTKANEELVELRKDKERLDWLTGLSRNKIECFNTESGSWIIGSSYDANIRLAIDSAIAAQEKMK